MSRFFAPQSGVDEDPVTGSAHCALAPYWFEGLGRDQGDGLTGYQVSARGGGVRLSGGGERVRLGGQGHHRPAGRTGGLTALPGEPATPVAGVDRGARVSPVRAARLRWDMRYVWLTLLLALGLGPVLVLVSPLAAPPAPAASASGGAPAPRDLARLLLAVTDTGVLVSSDAGQSWHQAAGLPRGSVSGLAAAPDPSHGHRPVAYVANGDIYQTTDAGYDWARLAAPPAGTTGPRGLTSLAVDPGDGTVYATGKTVLAYRGGGWTSWGQHWPSDATPTLLLVGPGHELYAAAGDRLYYLSGDGATATWSPVRLAGQRRAPITALGLGPGGRVVDVAAPGHIWTVDRATAYPLLMDNFPDARTVLLQGDPHGITLYAATDAGLYRTAISTPGDGGNGWQQVGQDVLPSAIVALQPPGGGQGWLAMGGDGTLYGRGQPTARTQAPRWLVQAPARQAMPVVMALLGTVWSGLAQQPGPGLPVIFSRGCAGDGRTSDQSVAICGPLAQFYRQFGKASVLGYPLEPAAVADGGRVTQRFERVTLQWTPRDGVTLMPLTHAQLVGLGFRQTPIPSVAEALAAGTPYFRHGYYVYPHFFLLWRAYQYQNNGLSIFGPPISGIFRTRSDDGSGRSVWVQFFRHARMEYADAAPASPTVSYLP